MQGVSGSSSKGAKVGFSGNPINFVDQSGSTATNNTFSLRAKALVVREDGGQASGGQQQSKQVDPALLARIAIDEELKRRGGGGGGGMSFNPNMWVSYSYKAINEALQQLYDLVNKITAQSANQVTSAVNNMASQLLSATANFFAPVTQPVQSFFTQLQKDLNWLARSFGNNPLEASLKLASNIMQMANAIFSAVANGLKKIIYGKDEERVDTDELLYEDEETVFSRTLGFRSMQDEDNEGTGRNMKAHLDNLAKQLTDWASSFGRR